MLKKLLFSLCLLACFQASAIRFTTNPLDENAPTGRVVCNLPAPSNLQTTGATPTSLSFAWDPVAGTDGYGTELIKTATGEQVYVDHIYSEFVTINGLLPDTEYEFRVWSICPESGERGGTSSRLARTDYAVIDDIIVDRQFRSDSSGNNFSLFVDDQRAESALLYRVLDSEGKYTLFEAEKNLQSAPSSVYEHHVEINHENGTREAPAEWVFGRDSLQIPYCMDLCQMTTDYVYVYRKFESDHIPVLRMNFPRNHDNTSLVWEQLMSGYEVRLCVPESGGLGGGGKGGNSRSNLFAQDDANGNTMVGVSPNPFTHQLVLRANHVREDAGQVKLVDLVSGRILHQADWISGDQYIFPTADLAPGAYIIRYETASAVQTIKVVKTNNP